MRAVDAWAIEEIGHALAGPDGARGRRPGARRRGRGRATARCAWWWARATTAATAWWPRATCARTATWWWCSPWLRSTSCAATRPRISSACRASRRSRSRRSGWPAREWWWTRCSAPASRARRATRWPRRSPRSTTQPAPVVACDVPSGVDASTRRGGRRGRGGRGHRDLPRVEARPVRGAGQEPRRGRGRGGDRRAARSARAASGRASSPSGCSTSIRTGRAAARSSTRAWWWWQVARSGSPARRRWPLARRSAPGAGYVQVAVPAAVQQVVELRLLEQMTRGLPDADGAHTPDGVEELIEMAERAGAVVLGPGLGRTDGARGVRAEGAARDRRRRCWWTPTA